MQTGPSGGGDSSSQRLLTKDLSTDAIGDIRSYFFKAIVELFCGYQDCMGEDEDGDTTFLITKFIQIRPDSYRQFYFSFFQGQLDALEHFGFLEFLNLTHSAANDSQQAEKKEIFDNFADIALRNKQAFREEAEEELVSQQTKPEDSGVQVQLVRVT